jgi:hypothetical protein
MDINSIFANAGGTAGIITLIGLLYKVINGRRCRSHCCGREMSADFKISDMPESPQETTLTPPAPKETLTGIIIQNNNPMNSHNGRV